MPVDEYTPKLGSLTMEDIVATDAQFAGCYFDGLPELSLIHIFWPSPRPASALPRLLP